MEAHPEIEQAIEMEETGAIAAPRLSDRDLRRIIKVAGVHQDRLRWPAIRTAIKERRGYPVEIARADDVSEQAESGSKPAEHDQAIQDAQRELGQDIEAKSTESKDSQDVHISTRDLPIARWNH
jgi:L,D-transpeptidase ErfK/SrfK